MALTDAENAAISSLLTGGVEAPLEEQPGTEEKPVELAMFGRAGSAASNFVQRMLFGDGLFKSRAILEDLKSGKREKLNLADMFVDPDAPAESRQYQSLFEICRLRRSKSIAKSLQRVTQQVKQQTKNLRRSRKNGYQINQLKDC